MSQRSDACLARCRALRRPYPVRRNVKSRVGSRRRIVARVATHNLTASRLLFPAVTFSTQPRRCSSRPSRRRAEVFTRRLVGRQRRIGVRVPTNTKSRLRTKQHGRRTLHGILKLSQRRDVIENPEASAVRRHAQIVALDDQITNRTRTPCLDAATASGRRRRTTT